VGVSISSSAARHTLYTQQTNHTTHLDTSTNNDSTHKLASKVGVRAVMSSSCLCCVIWPLHDIAIPNIVWCMA